MTFELPSREEIEREIQYRAEHKIESYFPETGALRRELYVKHLEFLEAGATKNERLFMAGNRVGKTDLGAYETTIHALGIYPRWWKGKRFSRPISAWVAGQNSRTVRDILQEALLGPGPQFGRGMIPADAILGTTPKPGMPESIETIYVRHISGGRSEIQFKTYETGPESFYGTGKDVIWCDEECPESIYTEALTRTLSTRPGEPNGIVLFTFTPLWGMTEIVRKFQSADAASQKVIITASWADCPHLDEATKAELNASIPEYQRDARTKGIPQLGSGAIYVISEQDLLVKPFAIPDYWPKGYGLDVGWNLTCAIFGALNPDDGILYIFSEHYMSKSEPYKHVQSIKSRGANLPGFIDPAAAASSQRDGRRLIDEYREQGLKLQEADNAVEAGIYAVWKRMCDGKLKIFTSVTNLYSELRSYRRDQNGKVVKEYDHACDALRYLVMAGANGLQRAPRQETPVYEYRTYRENEQRWMM